MLAWAINWVLLASLIHVTVLKLGEVSHSSCATYSAEVLLVLANSLHLRGVKHRHEVGHGLLSLLLVFFLLDGNRNRKTQQRDRDLT